MLLNSGSREILESPLDCKEIKPVNPKGNQSWIFVRRADAEAEVPIPWPPDAKNRLFRKDPDAGKDWRQEEKEMTEDEMVGWHHQLNRYEFEQALGVGDRQGSLVCCSPWGHRESDMTEWLNKLYNNKMLQRIHTRGIVCCVLSCSVMSNYVAHQAPLSMGILQARILEWVAMSSSRGSSWPRSPALQADSLPSEPQGKPPGKQKN